MELPTATPAAVDAICPNSPGCLWAPAPAAAAGGAGGGACRAGTALVLALRCAGRRGGALLPLDCRGIRGVDKRMNNARVLGLGSRKGNLHWTCRDPRGRGEGCLCYSTH